MQQAFFLFFKKIFELTGLQRNEIFLDLGHGLGNAPIQAAATIGCEGRGLELVENRCLLSFAFQEMFCNLTKENSANIQQVCFELHMNLSLLPKSFSVYVKKVQNLFLSFAGRILC